MLMQRIKEIIRQINQRLHEREEVVAVALLAALAGQHTFLLAPPGTAKSLISRQIAKAFKTNKYFEYLMQRFSTPEEIFGPVSIAELKNDKYVRKTEGFLPTADFAFLDEIWKASPAILNTLLTLANEKTFRNGMNLESVPLKSLIAASNETPPQGQGLEALYDRFLVRLHAPPLEQPENFASLLQAAPCSVEDLPENLTISNEEFMDWQKKIEEIKLSDDTLEAIRSIRFSLQEKGEKLSVYVSDRRWQKSAMLMRASAFFCGREETNLVDTLLLRHCLWSSDDDREEVIKCVEDSVKEIGFNIYVEDLDLRKNLDEKNKLEKEIYGEIKKMRGIEKIHSGLISHFNKRAFALIRGFQKIIYYVEEKYEKLKLELDTLFVPEVKRGIIFEGVRQQLDDMRKERYECECMKKKCKRGLS